MTKEEFIAAYCAESNLTWEEVSRRRVCLPCKCDYVGCDGWAMVSRDPDLIANHNMFCSPDEEARDEARRYFGY